MGYKNRRKKNDIKKSSREPNIQYQRQSVYTYRSSRKEVERALNRGEELNGGVNVLKIIPKLSKVALVIVALAGFFYIQSLAPDANLKIIGDSASLRAENTYQERINTKLKQSIFNRSKLTIDQKAISDDLKSAFPEIESVKVTVPVLRQKPVFEVALAKPVVKLVTVNETYILDGQGRALFAQSKASTTVNSESLIIIKDSSGHPIVLGKPAVTSEQIEYIKEVLSQAQNKKLTLKEINLSTNGSGADIAFKQNDYLVKFSFLANPRQSIGAYLVLREQLEKENIQPSNYIDLRIPDRAYVK